MHTPNFWLRRLSFVKFAVGISSLALTLFLDRFLYDVTDLNHSLCSWGAISAGWFIANGGLLPWRSHNQITVALSSMEVEYIALSNLSLIVRRGSR